MNLGVRLHVCACYGNASRGVTLKARVKPGCLGQHVHLCQGYLLPSLELAMPERKMLRNHSREYWYMGSTLARSDTQKKRTGADGHRNVLHASESLSFSVCSGNPDSLGLGVQ